MAIPLSRESSEEILLRHDRYIVAHVKHIVHQSSTFAHQAVLDLEIDELVQRVRIKFWRVLEKGPVLYPRAYLRRIIHSEYVDMRRQQKLFLPLPTEEEEHGYEERGLLCGESPDPADEVDQYLQCLTRLEEAIQMILRLPPRQQLAIICSLQERVDDLAQLVAMFKKYRTNIETIQWPVERAEKQLLQASLSAARSTLAKNMKVEIRTKWSLPAPIDTNQSCM